MKPALFIDRDGTISKDCPYCKNASEIKLYDDIYKPLSELSKTYYIIIITNQSGVGRGYFTENDLKSMHEKIKHDIAARGGRIDAIYYCPHLPAAGCRCRKPALGLLEDAKGDFDIDINRSFVIGDAEIDIEMARNAGIKCIKVRNKTGSGKADFYADNFSDVLSIIKREEAKRFGSN
jgi:D-glycero-D-manno-heptose 1,7-bisphosphate phosphatase